MKYTNLQKSIINDKSNILYIVKDRMVGVTNALVERMTNRFNRKDDKSNTTIYIVDSRCYMERVFELFKNKNGYQKDGTLNYIIDHEYDEDNEFGSGCIFLRNIYNDNLIILKPYMMKSQLIIGHSRLELIFDVYNIYKLLDHYLEYKNILGVIKLLEPLLITHHEDLYNSLIIVNENNTEIEIRRLIQAKSGIEGLINLEDKFFQGACLDVNSYKKIKRLITGNQSYYDIIDTIDNKNIKKEKIKRRDDLKCKICKMESEINKLDTELYNCNK